MNYSKELKVGLTALVSLVTLYFGFNYLKGLNVFSAEHKYYVMYPSTVELTVSSPVTVNGFAVGKVSKMHLMPQKNHAIVVELRIRKDLALGHGTIAELESSNILGGKIIALHISHQAPVHKAGDTLQSRTKRTITDFLGETTMGDDISSSIRRINEILVGMKGSGELTFHMLDKMDTLISTISNVTTRNQTLITQSVRNLYLGSEALKQSLRHADSLLIASTQQIKSVDLSQTNQLITQVSQTFTHINKLLEQLQRPDGSLGKLLYTDELHAELKKSLTELTSLLTHFNQRPKDFMAPLGRSEKKIRRKKKKAEKNRQNE